MVEDVCMDCTGKHKHFQPVIGPPNHSVFAALAMMVLFTGPLVFELRGSACFRGDAVYETAVPPQRAFPDCLVTTAPRGQQAC